MEQAEQAGANVAGVSGSEPMLAGAPAMLDPSTASRPCTARDAPGKRCDAPRCLGERCGVRFELFCMEGAWGSGDSSLAWDLVCPVASEPIYDIRDIKQGACCGDVLPRRDLYTEPNSCSLCPEAAPVDGDPCALPDDCKPAIIDCFYKCCCYGNLTWAQCDGQEWHVATNCSAK